MKIQSIQNSLLSRNLKFKSSGNNFYHSRPIGQDIFVFSLKDQNKTVKPLNVNYTTASKIVHNLSTATSGHRAPWMSETFSPEAVNLIALGVAEYAKENSLKHGKPTVIIGGDTREATRKSLPKIKDTLTKQGVDVIYMEDPVPTPLLALSANKFGLGISILMTASHNPWTDGGFNFITPEGAVAPTEVTGKIAQHIDKIAKRGTYTEDIVPTGEVYGFNPYSMYKKELEKSGLIDFEKIKKSGVTVYYDCLGGTGRYVMPKLLREYNIPCEEVTSSGQIGPNPTDENLKELARFVEWGDEELKIGLANDGDADRFGVIDEEGDFISPNDVLLLVAYHLVKNKGLKGDIVRNQGTTQLLKTLGEKYGLITHETPVGFKYLAHDILQAREEGRDIIVAGEDSGGLTTYGHIPEKDGILADFLILDLVADEQKPLSRILKNIKSELGYETFIENESKRLKDDTAKQKVMQKVENRFNSALEGDVDFGEMHKVDIDNTIKTAENIRKYRPEGDGFKFVMTDGSTVLVRKSGTEPVMRFNIEATGKTWHEAEKGAESLKEYIDSEFSEE